MHFSRTLTFPQKVQGHFEKGSGIPTKLYLFLHGYGQKGKILFEKFRPLFPSVLPAGVALLSPDAPYFSPIRTSSGELKSGFAWYIYNPMTDEYIRDMTVAKQYLTLLKQELGLGGVSETTIVGFSQGGYVAPFVAEEWPEVSRVVGLGSSFLADEMKSGAPRFECIEIMGAQDDTVEPAGSEREIDQLRARGAKAQFILVPGGSHRVDEHNLSVLKEVLLK